MLRKFHYFLHELKQAWHFTADVESFLVMAFSTILYHLGNIYPPCHTQRNRRIRCHYKNRIFKLHFRQNQGDVFTIYEIFTTFPYDFPWPLDGRVNTIVDLGAHLGFSTLCFHAQFPDSRIISLEPAPGNYQLLTKNLATNDIPAIPLEKCIGPQAGEVTFYLNQSSNQNSLLTPKSHHRTKKTIQVKMITLPQLMKDHSLKQIDLLKVDIEGGEEALFSPSITWIDQVRCIVIEIHPQIVDYQKVVDSIVHHGFTFHAAGSLSRDYDVFIRQK